MKKILLINPPFYRFIGLEQDYVPLSLLAVGSWYSQKFDVKMLNLEIGGQNVYKGYSDRTSGYDKYIVALNDDNNEAWQYLRAKIEEIKPDRVGITILNVKSASAIKVIQIVQSYGIDCVVGGAHPTTDPNFYLNNANIKPVTVYHGDVDSQSLDETALPNFDILLDRYSLDGYAHINTARGCPYRCTFCGSQAISKKVRYKSVERVLKEMIIIDERFHPKFFTIWDETFTHKKERVLDFCSKYSLPPRWRCDTRADALDEERVVAMKGAGCEQMSVGIESGNDEILKKINKRETTEDYKKAAELLNKYNIPWKAYCIVGFPFETEENIIETIEFTKSLKPFRITVSYFTPYPGTVLYDECQSRGLLPKDYDLAKYSHQSPHNYFSYRMTKGRYNEVRDWASKEADEYNKEAIKIWK